MREGERRSGERERELEREEERRSGERIGEICNQFKCEWAIR